ncbi:hypothetical protein NM208_g987 [Fusarium decemcellulare]|uniref:Uncharacterized protein n=1 Tax=Fusarium decemcellulare TaxID=57161 RepID=A0ACC1SXP7_9HYPO|nr:hypothetical protein NM208_g987 [Fusarium decemcellulare]
MDYTLEVRDMFQGPLPFNWPDPPDAVRVKAPNYAVQDHGGQGSGKAHQGRHEDNGIIMRGSHDASGSITNRSSPEPCTVPLTYAEKSAALTASLLRSTTKNLSAKPVSIIMLICEKFAGPLGWYACGPTNRAKRCFQRRCTFVVGRGHTMPILIGFITYGYSSYSTTAVRH